MTPGALRSCTTSSRIALPPQLATPTTSDIHQHADHAHQTLTDTKQLAQVLPRLARRGLTCSRSVTWQQCQGTVVHAESHLAHPGRVLQQIAPLNIFTSLRLVTARAPKRSEATFPPRSPPARCLVRAPLQRMAAGARTPLPYQLHRRPQARPSASASVLSTCCPTYYCVPVCSVILTRRGYPDQPAQCAIVAAHTH